MSSSSSFTFPSSPCTHWSPYAEAKRLQSMGLIEKEKSRYEMLLLMAIYDCYDHVEEAINDLIMAMETPDDRDFLVSHAKFYYKTIIFKPDYTNDDVKLTVQVLIKIYEHYGMTDQIAELLQDKLKHMKL